MFNMFAKNRVVNPTTTWTFFLKTLVITVATYYTFLALSSLLSNQVQARGASNFDNFDNSIQLNNINATISIKARDNRRHTKPLVIKTNSIPWWVPDVKYGPGAEYLCPCGGYALSEEHMLLPIKKQSNITDKETLYRVCGLKSSFDRSHERHRQICAYWKEYGIKEYLHVLSHTAVPHAGALKGSKAIRVLHNAPEKSVAFGLGLVNNSEVDYVGFDYKVGPLVHNAGLNEFSFDLANIPFPSNYFDLIITSHVLEHVPNVTACLLELFRVLRPGGVGFIAAPVKSQWATTKEETQKEMRANNATNRMVMYGQSDHLRLFGRDFRFVVESSGFCTDPTMPDFFQRPFIKEKVAAYRNTEFVFNHTDYGMAFVYKTGEIIPFHISKSC